MSWDEIASEYDELFSDQISVSENLQVMKMLNVYPIERVLDIGCGTGLFLDYAPHPTANYIGTDTSANMLRAFKRKHPNHVTVQTGKLTKIESDVAIALFGSASYHDLAYLKFVRRSVRRVFFMFYKPNYMPVTYVMTGKCLEHYIYTIQDLKVLGDVSLFKNFIIVQ